MDKVMQIKIGKVFMYILGWIGVLIAGYVCWFLIKNCASGYPPLVVQDDTLPGTVFKIGVIAGAMGILSLWFFMDVITPIVKWLWYKFKHSPKGFIELW